MGFNHVRTNVLKWLIRLAERCKISDKSWFKAVTVFDEVVHQFEDMSEFNAHFKVAGVALYLCSKCFDDKYLYLSMFKEGVKLTRIGKENDHSIIVEEDTILKLES